MKPLNDVFELFREKQRVLEEVPSHRTWRRIERRLNAHARPSRRSGLRRGLLLSGGLLAFVFLTGVLVLQNSPHLGSSAPWSSSDNTFQVEPLQGSNMDLSTANKLEYSRHYSAAEIRVPEGAPGQELIVRP